MVPSSGRCDPEGLSNGGTVCRARADTEEIQRKRKNGRVAGQRGGVECLSFKPTRDRSHTDRSSAGAGTTSIPSGLRRHGSPFLISCAPPQGTGVWQAANQRPRAGLDREVVLAKALFPSLSPCRLLHAKVGCSLSPAAATPKRQKHPCMPEISPPSTALRPLFQAPPGLLACESGPSSLPGRPGTSIFSQLGLGRTSVSPHGPSQSELCGTWNAHAIVD